MATTTGPLMSLDASGTIAKTITFAKWKGRNYVRTRVIPHNPKSATQTATRSLLRFLATQWAAVPIDNTTWMPLADSKKISPFNEFVAYNMAQFTQFILSSQTYPNNPAAGIPTAGALTGVPGVRQITGTMTDATGATPWGVAIFASMTPAFTTARDNMRLVIPIGLGATVAFTLTGLTPGNWYISAREFGVTGGLSAAVADVGPLTVLAS